PAAAPGRCAGRAPAPARRPVPAGAAAAAAGRRRAGGGGRWSGPGRQAAGSGCERRTGAGALHAPALAAGAGADRARGRYRTSGHRARAGRQGRGRRGAVARRVRGAPRDRREHRAGAACRRGGGRLRSGPQPAAGPAPAATAPVPADGGVAAEALLPGASAGPDGTGVATLPAPPAAVAEDGFDPAAIPPLSLDVDDLRYRGTRFGTARLRTRPTDDGLLLESLQLRADWQQADVTGHWTGRGELARTQLDMDVRSEDMGRLMTALGYADFLARGEGTLRLQAAWAGSPAGFRLGELEGSLRIDARNGQLLEVEPGAGRVLGLLSVAQLPRRLLLDFRDFF